MADPTQTRIAQAIATEIGATPGQVGAAVCRVSCGGPSGVLR